jgi:hypothetical protein
VPYLLVIVLALMGVNVLVVLIVGTVIADVIALIGGDFQLLTIFTAAGDGLNSMCELILVTLLAGGVMVSGDYLLSTAAMMVMLLGTKYLIRCIMRTDSFNDLSLAMLYYGTLPLIIAPSALLYVALPILVLMVRSTWRDWVVAVASLLFPLFAVCYWNWCAGEGFIAMAEQIYTSAFTASEFSFFSTLNVAGIALLGVIIVMVLCAITLIISDKYSIKVKSRAVMRFNALMLVITVAMFFLPSATASLFALVAVPAAMLIPLIFVRMGVGFTETLYRLMLVAAAANMVIMCL